MLPVFLSDDLVVEVLSFLTGKSLMRFKSVSKRWNTLISDATFVKLHRQNSPRNMHMVIKMHKSQSSNNVSVETFPLNHLIENPSMTFLRNPCNRLEINSSEEIVGSCNGLVCLVGDSLTYDTRYDEHKRISFRVWNPTTNTTSKQLGYRTCKRRDIGRYTFGYDNSTATYKVVVLYSTSIDEPYTSVKILNLGDNSWRTISSFPPYGHVILCNNYGHRNNYGHNHGLYLKGTVNWFAIRSTLSKFYWGGSLRDDITISVDQLLIISLDLGTETYMQFSLPHGVDEVPYVEPIIVELMDCLCFSHNLKGTHFVIWIMTEFGVEQSWTQFLNISFQNLQVDVKFDNWRSCQLLPLCLSENGHTLILRCSDGVQSIFYNLRDNRVLEKTCGFKPWFNAKYYVESLASIC